MSDVLEAAATSSGHQTKPLTTWHALLEPEQLKAFDFALRLLQTSGGCGLFSQQGTGKTIISLALLEKLQPARVLIVAPLTALEPTWQRRLEQDSATQVYRTLEKFRPASLFEYCSVLLIHFQLFSKLSEKLQKMPWDMVIIDESQSTKNRNSGFSRAARRLRNAPRRLMLSGTPIDDSPLDVWAQMRFIDHTVLGEQWGTFASQYCERTGYMGREWQLRRSRQKAYLDAIKPYCYRLTKDFLNLPPVSLVPVPITMLGHQRQLYDQMESTGLLQLDGRTILGDLAVTKQIKLEQITGGLVRDEDGDLVRSGHCKERKFHIIRKKLTPPFVVCCRFRHEMNLLRIQMLNDYKRVECLHGGIKKGRTKLIDDFQAGAIDVLICQQRTGGVSVEFTRAKDIIIFSMSHSSIDFDQFIARLHRYGQKQTVTVWLLYVVDSRDEELMENVQRKLKDNTVVLKEMERV